MSLRRYVVGVLCISTLGTVINGFAQETTGELRGRIEDQTGAVVVDATVFATGNTLVGESSTRTLRDGTYDLPGLPPGRYTLRVIARGFRRRRCAVFCLLKRRSSAAGNALDVGTPDEVIEVEGKAPQIDFKEK